jgi:predicted nucleic acid-binding protein
MTYLVDANILSEPTKQRPDPKVLAWLSANEMDFVVDSIVLGEIAIGILVLPRGRKRAQLEQWLAVVTERIDCLPWDAIVSRRWAQLVADLRKKGQTLPVLDSMIAATAMANGLTVATHNVRDFQKTGVSVVDPFLPQ